MDLRERGGRVVTLHGSVRSYAVRRGLRVLAVCIEGVERVNDRMEDAPAVLLDEIVQPGIALAETPGAASRRLSEARLLVAPIALQAMRGRGAADRAFTGRQPLSRQSGASRRAQDAGRPETASKGPCETAQPGPPVDDAPERRSDPIRRVAAAKARLVPADARLPLAFALGAVLLAAGGTLYRSKADGRGMVRCFEPGMDAALAARRRLTQDLRTAAAEGDFQLAYQPLHRLADGALVGFEALLRWQYAERGPVPPDAFIPIAEETGLIVPIGAWVLRRACAEASGWPDGLRIAVNLSPVQFRRGADLVALVRDALAVSGLPPDRLELEITEGILLHDTDAALRTLTELRALGCSIAMDDFGTGHSSLGYLWRFPFDKLKIDRSFVLGMGEDPKAAAIVCSVVALGRALGLTVIAEGVETAEQVASLRDAGCAQGQGFLLGRPAPTAAVAARFALGAAGVPGGVAAAEPAAS